jgi:Dolichyl-phosphate-mannose-protein mannosyltransferase
VKLRPRWAVVGLVTAAIALGIAFRVVIYRSSLGYLGTDEATWGLMARHVLHGEASAFFWGQSYGGTQEVFPVAALFGLFGTHLVLMRIVPIAFSIAAAGVLWVIARRLYGETAALSAALLLWIWPIYEVWKIEIWSGFYGAALLDVALVLLLCIRLDEAPSARLVAIFGLVVGLAAWESVQTFAVILPAVAWLTFRRPRLWARAWIALPGLVLGALPSLLSNLHHDWWSLTFHGSGGTYESRLRGYFSSTLPMALGLRVPFAVDWTFGVVLSVLGYGAAVIVFLVLAWRWRRRELSLLPVVIVAYPFVYAVNGMTSNTSEPRYVFVLLPVVVLMIASLATDLTKAALVLCVAAAVSSVVLVRWNDWHRAPARERGLNPGEVALGPTITALERSGVTRAYATYSVADRMTFDTRERIVVSEADLSDLKVAGPGRVLPPAPTNYTEHHHPAYDRAVRAARRFAYVFVQGEPDEARDVRLLVANGYRRTDVGTMVVLFSPPQP